ncbi:hypothetical protein J7E70_10990 [Variovorax paradoxus]|nr:hypothetical protein [Variovorax paradoxus]
MRDIVKERGALAGVGDNFSAHSLRSGFVTEAGRQNMPLQETMAMTGHRSADVVTGYFRAARRRRVRWRHDGRRKAKTGRNLAAFAAPLCSNVSS